MSLYCIHVHYCSIHTNYFAFVSTLIIINNNSEQVDLIITSDHILYQPHTDHIPTTPTTYRPGYQPHTNHIQITYWPHTNHKLTTYHQPHILTTCQPHLPTTFQPHTNHILITPTVLLYTDQINLFTVTLLVSGCLWDWINFGVFFFFQGLQSPVFPLCFQGFFSTFN